MLRIYGKKKVRKSERFEREFEDSERAEEDDFRLAISITTKGLKFFTPFTSCDIIITSLVGLRLATSAKATDKNATANVKKGGKPQAAEGAAERDFSFLSSVEILVIDRAHVLLM